MEQSKPDPKFEEGIKRSIRNLEELRFSNPTAWKKEVQLRYLDRRMVDWQPYPEYQRLLEEWRKARSTDCPD